MAQELPIASEGDLSIDPTLNIHRALDLSLPHRNVLKPASSLASRGRALPKATDSNNNPVFFSSIAPGTFRHPPPPPPPPPRVGGTSFVGANSLHVRTLVPAGGAVQRMVEPSSQAAVPKSSCDLINREESEQLLFSRPNRVHANVRARVPAGGALQFRAVVERSHHSTSNSGCLCDRHSSVVRRPTDSVGRVKVGSNRADAVTVRARVLGGAAGFGIHKGSNCNNRAETRASAPAPKNSVDDVDHSSNYGRLSNFSSNESPFMNTRRRLVLRASSSSDQLEVSPPNDQPPHPRLPRIIGGRAVARSRMSAEGEAGYQSDSPVSDFFRPRSNAFAHALPIDNLHLESPPNNSLSARTDMTSNAKTRVGLDSPSSPPGIAYGGFFQSVKAVVSPQIENPPWIDSYIKQIRVAAVPIANSKNEIALKFAGDGDVQVTTFRIPITCPLSARLIDIPCRLSECPIDHLFDAASFLKAYGEAKLASLNPSRQFAGMYEGDPKCPKCRRALRAVHDLVYERYIADLIKDKKYNSLTNNIEFSKNGAELCVTPSKSAKKLKKSVSPKKNLLLKSSAVGSSANDAIYVGDHNSDADDDIEFLSNIQRPVFDAINLPRYDDCLDADDSIEIIE